jgi:hypothetical protein
LALDPARPPPPAVAAAARWRTGARRRASYQMKNEIAPIKTSAPIAIRIALVPLRVLLPDVWVCADVITVGVAVVVGAGVGEGVSGERGLVSWPRALAGRASAALASASTTTERTKDFNVRYSVASGCSIAGVCGAST